MTGEIMYEDRFGAVIDRPDDDYIEIRWYDATEALSRNDFNNWLAGFAGGVEMTKRSGVLVDSVQFRMDMSQMDADWRDAHIVPRYNAVGIEKFAFLMPDGMPLIGAEPTYDGPAEYPTAYFGTRQRALDWLAS